MHQNLDLLAEADYNALLVVGNQRLEEAFAAVKHQCDAIGEPYPAVILVQPGKTMQSIGREVIEAKKLTTDTHIFLKLSFTRFSVSGFLLKPADISVESEVILFQGFKHDNMILRAIRRNFYK